jgi:hypothetical protein
MTNFEYAESLRMLADFYEQHLEVPPPYNAAEHSYCCLLPEDMTTIARALGTCEKEYAGEVFYLKKDIGRIKFSAFIMREKICKRVVTGTKQVPKRVIPAHVEEIVEWKCFEKPLLAEPISIDAPLAQVIRHELEEANNAD